MIPIFLIQIIGLIFLIYFSYKDVKYSKIENYSILIFLLVSLIIFFNSNNFLIQIIIFLFWIVVGVWMYWINVFGGADVKILPIISIYLIYLMPNVYSANWVFLISLGIFGTIYGLFSKILIKKKEVPFIPIFTLSYIMVWIIGQFIK